MRFCLASGIAFGAMAVFGKLAYAEGATVGTLLAIRFTLASGLFWVGRPERVARRDVLAALALGGAYAVQAGCYFAALQRLDAGVLALLVYTFPAFVALAGRERLTRRRTLALALSLGGLALVVGAAGALDPLGVALALATAMLYAAYILASDGIAQRVPPRTLAALVCSGAAVALMLGTIALGQFRPQQLTVAGWGWIACLAAISTVGAIGLFFAGLKRVGPTTAAILATVEPLATVALAFLVFGEALGPLQLAGGALVLAAVGMIRA